MKIAVLSESSADEAAISILVEGLLGANFQRVLMPAPKTRGWQGVLAGVDPALRYLHYCTDADALVVTLDSDLSPVHRREHAQPGADHAECRLCQLSKTIGIVQGCLRPR